VTDTGGEVVRLAFRPVDVVLFREGGRFVAGADHRARSLLPPPQRTLIGALRTSIARQLGWTVGKELPRGLGTSDDLGDLRCLGSFVGEFSDEGTVCTYHPIPADCDLAGERLMPAQHSSPEWVASDVGLEMPWVRVEVAKHNVRWIDDGTLKQYLLKGATTASRCELPFKVEPRVGLQLEAKKRVASEGRLYVGEFLRGSDRAAFVLDVALPKSLREVLPEEGCILSRLGGEGRMASIEVVKGGPRWPSAEEVYEAVKNDRCFRLYFLTPAPVKANPWWKPPNLLRSGGAKGVLGDTNVEVRVTWFAIRSLVHYGGFDLCKGEALRRAPALGDGSVYHVEMCGVGVSKEVVEGLHCRSLFGSSSREGKEGLGIVLVGKCYGAEQ
jgi:CRISPR-associated protein Cmr3